MSITIKGINKKDTAYDKRITFEREGVEYFVLLHWDSYDGFYLDFLKINGKESISTPDWVWEWNEDDHDGETLESVLDQLTDEVMEESE